MNLSVVKDDELHPKLNMDLNLKPNLELNLTLNLEPNLKLNLKLNLEPNIKFVWIPEAKIQFLLNVKLNLAVCIFQFAY